MAGLGARLRLLGKAAVGVFDEQSAKAAYGLLSGVLPGGHGLPPVRGTKEYLRAYSDMPWLRAVSARIASSVSRTEWQLFVRGKPNERARRDWVLQRSSNPVRRAALLKQAQADGDLRQIETHPLLDLLDRANSFQTGDSMRKVTQLHLDLVGEAFWLKERDGLGMVTAVWPIPPDWVVNTPTPAHPFYRVQFRAWRGLIPDTEILCFQDPDPANPYGRGSGTAQALADELETDEYAAKHTKAFFYNRARPDLVVFPKAPATMREADVRRAEEDWTSRNQGFWRAFKPYFMTREVGIHEMDQNFRSLQLVQLREYERNAVIQIFGMPPELLGVIENSNRATINAADFLMAKYVLEPRLEFLRSVFQERLVPEFDERLIINYVSPVTDDEELRLKAATAAPWAQSVDEWREMMGREKLEDDKGKVHVFTSGLTEHTMGEEPPPPDPMAPPVAVAPGDDEEEDDADMLDDVDAEEEPEPPKGVDVTAWQAWRRSARRLLRGRDGA